MFKYFKRLFQYFKRQPKKRYCAFCGSELVSWTQDNIVLHGKYITRFWTGCPNYNDPSTSDKYNHMAYWVAGKSRGNYDTKTGKPLN